jgi:hypothetical protein
MYGVCISSYRLTRHVVDYRPLCLKPDLSPSVLPLPRVTSLTFTKPDDFTHWHPIAVKLSQ